jgi:uncharacterized membrane protein YhaH (DUF805 family)
MYSSNDMPTIAPLVLMGCIHRRLSARGSFLLVISNLPVTIMHEAAHYAVATLLGGKPTGFTLWPKRNGGRWILGSVAAQASLLSAAPTAFAPLLWLLPGWILLIQRHHLSGYSLKLQCLMYLAVYLCVAASVPSCQDLKVAVSHPSSLLLWTAIVVAAVYAAG